MNILCRVCFNQSWVSSLDSIRLHCSAVCVTLIYCHLTTPEILLADLFSFLTYFTFTTWLLCTTFCFFSSLFCYFIHLRSIICSLETKLNCFALPTAPQRVRRRLLFVTLCPSRFKILPLLLSRDTVRLIRARMMSLIRDNSLLSSFQRGKAKVVSGDEGLNDFVQDFAGHFNASVGKKGFTSISVSDM